MWVEWLHSEVDNLQSEKLNYQESSDTPIEDIANREIDAFQKTLLDLPQSEQEQAMVLLKDFLNELWGSLEISDLETLFEILAPNDGHEKKSLPNGMPSLEAHYAIEWQIDSLMAEIDKIAPLQISEQDKLDRLFDLMKHTSETPTWGVSSETQTQLYQKTETVYQDFSQKTGISRETMQQYLVFWPTLFWDIESEEVQDYYGDISNKEQALQSATSQEQKLYIMRVWEFMSMSPQEQRTVVSNNNSFAENLRDFGVKNVIENIEITEFSQDGEVIEKKTQLFDSICEKCSGEELEQVLSVYQIYLEYTWDSCSSVEEYLSKLDVFDQMLEDEFSKGWSIIWFLDGLISTGATVLRLKKVSKFIWEIKRVKSYIENNTLEAAIFTASFCPRAGDVLDMAYGAYKFSEGENLSWEKADKISSCIQVASWCIWLGANLLFPGAGTWIKAFLKAAPEWKIMKAVVSKIQKFMPKLSQLLQKFKEDMLTWLKELKDFFAKNIFPLIKWEVQQLFTLAK